MKIEKLQALINAAYRTDEYPAMLHQQQQWCATRPLAGKVVLDASPVFRNTTAKYLALLAAGAELIVGLSDALPYDHAVLELLEEAGVRVVRAHDQPQEVDLVLDCAAAFIGWPARIGYVELTRSGTDIYAASGHTVFMADSGRIKRVETCLGTGESYFRAMAALRHTEWDGRRIVIFGSGKVGTGIATYAHKYGAEVVVVTDPTMASTSLRTIISELIDFHDRESVERVVANAYAIVSATGVAGAVGECCSPKVLIESKAIIANMGVDDEFGPCVPCERVVRAKQPLNFMLDEPTHMKYIDATLALHNEGAAYLVTNPALRGVVMPPDDMEQALLDISVRNGSIASELALLFAE